MLLFENIPGRFQYFPTLSISISGPDVDIFHAVVYLEGSFSLTF